MFSFQVNCDRKNGVIYTRCTTVDMKIATNIFLKFRFDKQQNLLQFRYTDNNRDNMMN
jgi:hypothetical protein